VVVAISFRMGSLPDVPLNTAWREKFLVARAKRRLHTAEAMTPQDFSEADRRHMHTALQLAERAAKHGDVPIGAVVARGDEALGEAGNERELRGDPTAHAEVLALREASEHLGGWRLLETTIYVTLEPCPMCAGAITLARVPRLVYGTADPKGGAVGSVIDLFAEPVVNHRPSVEGGLLAGESAALLEAFFSDRR
jgi:tRNA(adenine34) deaminase